jgi:hypothetical protein
VNEEILSEHSSPLNPAIQLQNISNRNLDFLSDFRIASGDLVSSIACDYKVRLFPMHVYL